MNPDDRLLDMDSVRTDRFTPGDLDAVTKALAPLADGGNEYASWLLAVTARVMTLKLNATPEAQPTQGDLWP